MCFKIHVCMSNIKYYMNTRAGLSYLERFPLRDSLWVIGSMPSNSLVTKGQNGTIALYVWWWYQYLDKITVVANKLIILPVAHLLILIDRFNELEKSELRNNEQRLKINKEKFLAKYDWSLVCVIFQWISPEWQKILLLSMLPNSY